MAGYDFEVMVIGGGGAGYAAASMAARHCAKVAMIESWKLGGTCLNVGCVPTKALLHAAKVLDTVRRAGQFGIHVADVRANYREVAARKDALVKGFSGEGPEESLRNQGITLLREHASFADRHTLQVGERQFRAEKIIVATGSVTARAAAAEAVPHLTSNEALDLVDLPPSMVIIGGGVIGCEFASLFNAFGVRTTIVGRRLLTREDPDLADELAQCFTQRGIALVQGRMEHVRRGGDGVEVLVRDAEGRESRATGHTLMIAAGREPNTRGLHLENAGIPRATGGIAVDATMRTAAPNVWACGDVTGKHMYTHSGDYGGEIAGWNATHPDDPRQADFRVVPRPVFSLPEFAAVGLTEAEARERGEVEVKQVRFSEVTRPIIDAETEGFVKVIADARDGTILGAGIVGAHATEMISEFVVAMAGRVSALTFGDSLHPYPTVSEVARWAADQVGKERERAEHGHICPDVSQPMLMTG